MKLRQIAEDLGVQYVMEGSVQESGERLRVTVQLIDALKGHHVWSEKYDRSMQDLFAVQDNITLNIAIAMEYLGDGEAEINLIKKAMRLDPYFAPWYSFRLGIDYRLVGRYEEAAETFGAALKRIENEKNSSIRGYFYQLAATYAMMGRIEEAKACLAKVLEINPKTSVEELAKSQLYRHPKYTEQFLEALRRSGLPEKPKA